MDHCRASIRNRADGYKASPAMEPQRPIEETGTRQRMQRNEQRKLEIGEGLGEGICEGIGKGIGEGAWRKI